MRSVRPAIALGVFVGALFFRLATFSITNDDYLHLSLAQQVLLGEVPGRDFIDPGELLFYYVSAGTQWLFGRNLLTEVLLDTVMLAAGYALAYLLAQRASRSHAAALIAVGIAVVLVPRLYSYPKIVLYAVALALLWRYADDRRRRWVAALALFTAIAFLFRHDHGTCIGIGAAAMIVLANWRNGAAGALRQAIVYGALTAVLLLPFFVFLQSTVGFVRYWRNTMETGRAEYQRTVGEFPVFSRAFAAPGIRVRWATGVSDADRQRLEARFHLARGADESGGTWRYDLTDDSSANISAMLAEPAIADTSGIDRELKIVTARVHEPNVDAWFYYLTIAMPPLALLIVVAGRLRGRERPLVEREFEKIATASLLAMVMHVYLLRAASDSAIADVSVPTAVLGAWLLAKGLRRGAPLAPLRMAASGLVLAVTLAAASKTDGSHLLELLVRGSSALTPMSERLDAMRRSQAPFDDEAAQYLHACTRETDRVLLTGYAPHVNYQSGRGFAAGRPYFLSSFAPAADFQAFSLERLQRQRVPVVLAAAGEDYAAFAAASRPVHGYIAAHYREAGEIDAAGARFRVLVDTRLMPARTFGARALPCF